MSKEALIFSIILLVLLVVLIARKIVLAKREQMFLNAKHKLAAKQLAAELKEKEGKLRTIEELLDALDIGEHYAFFPGWLASEELELLYKAGWDCWAIIPTEHDEEYHFKRIRFL